MLRVVGCGVGCGVGGVDVGVGDDSGGGGVVGGVGGGDVGGGVRGDGGLLVVDRSRVINNYLRSRRADPQCPTLSK